jgi:hypothetical protein
LNLGTSLILKKLLKTARYTPHVTLTLLGDDLADRGCNDIFMLILYSVLDINNVPYMIILSNHGEVGLRSICSAQYQEEIGYYYKENEHTLYASLQTSLKNLWALIDEKVIKLGGIQHLANQHYTAHVCLIGYHVTDEGALVIYTHAPISLHQIQILAMAWDVAYRDDSISALTHCIDELNQSYRLSVGPGFDSMSPVDLDAPPHLRALRPFLWQRELPDDFTLTPKNAAFEIMLYHGHIGETLSAARTPSESDRDKLYNFDTHFGKVPLQSTGTLRIAITPQPPTLRTQYIPHPLMDKAILHQRLLTLKRQTFDTKTRTLHETTESDSPSQHFITLFRQFIEALEAEELVNVDLFCAMPYPLSIDALAEAILNEDSELSRVLSHMLPSVHAFELLDEIEDCATTLLGQTHYAMSH